MPLSTRESYVAAANDLEALGTPEAYREAQKLKAKAMHLPADAVSTEDAAKKHDEKARSVIALRAEIAELESKAQFAAAAPLKSRITLLLTSPN
jgi:hypothetical protein